jgi:hypothetical protein
VGAVGLGLGHGGNKNMRLDSWGSELSEGRGELRVSVLKVLHSDYI